MRRAIWMALAFMGTAPLVALAQQQNAGEQAGEPDLAPPAASPSGTSSVQRGQDTAGMGGPGAPGQQPAGSVGTGTGEPATGGSGAVGTDTQGEPVTRDTGKPVGLDSVPLQRSGPQGDQGLTGSGTGTGGSGAAGGGATYQGTSQEEPPSATPPVDVGNPKTGTAGTGTGGTGGGSTVGGGGTARAPLPRDPESMRRELLNLRQRVSRLENELDALRGTGGGGTAGTGDTGTTDTSNVQVQGPVTLAITTFDGRVVDVTRRHIDIVDTSDGSFYRLSLNDRTKAFVGPQLDRIPVQQLSEGTTVRTSFALISTGDQQALNIVAQPQRPQQQQSPRR